jgi:hypothetical protein
VEIGTGRGKIQVRIATTLKGAYRELPTVVQQINNPIRRTATRSLNDTGAQPGIGDTGVGL